MDTSNHLKASAGTFSEDCRIDGSVVENLWDTPNSRSKPKRSIWDRDEVPRKVAVVRPTCLLEDHVNPSVRQTEQQAIVDQGQIRTIYLDERDTVTNVFSSSLSDRENQWVTITPQQPSTPRADSTSESDSESDSDLDELNQLWCQMFELVAERYLATDSDSESDSDLESDSTSMSTSGLTSRPSSISSSSLTSSSSTSTTSGSESS